jgi:PhoPQ-activated pathogenicity-related protein
VQKLFALGAGLAVLYSGARLQAADAQPGALADYVGKPDPSYRWVKRREGKLSGGTFVELTLTSQTWKGIVWKHQLFLYKPAQVRDPSRALLLIGGGEWSDALAQPSNETNFRLPNETNFIVGLAAQIQAPVALLLHVPQQPIFGGMVEDQIISYTLEQFLRTEDSTWPLLFPMVKSVVRAMDAVQTFTKQEWQLDLRHFTLTGASKRGWTTWLTAAVDPRVEALAPRVIDTLNMGPQMKHQLATWGRYSEQIDDYTRRGIQQHIASPSGGKLLSIIDPYAYRETLTQPKLILLGTNDPYWPLDALSLYWDGLVGEKYVLYIPNSGHDLRDFGRVVGTVSALHRHVAGELQLPKLEWKFDASDEVLTLRLTSDKKPAQVLAWAATSSTKDFRNANWTSYEAQAIDGGHQFRLKIPPRGYAALFGEAMFATDKLPYYLSTNVKIISAKP